MPLSHTKLKISFCRSTLAYLCLGVEHGSHNVSRWMTWLSISLKNAAACDKWYQLQNHFITESLNANGAWEKPFVGHPRACHTQCRTNKKSSQTNAGSPSATFGSTAFELRARAQARYLIHIWCAAVWLGVCCAGGVASTRFLAARLAQPNVFKKETLRYFFTYYTNSVLVYRPEHGRTTRRT